MPFHKFEIRSETFNEVRSFSINDTHSKDSILEKIKEEINDEEFYEIRYHKCNHDIPKKCDGSEVVAQKGELPSLE